MSDELSRSRAELEKIEQTLAFPEALPEAQREILLSALRGQRDTLVNRIAVLTGPGAIAQGDGAVSAGQEGLAVGGNVGGPIIVAGEGATVVIGEQPIETPAVADQESALAQYLRHIISRNRYLRLQGIRSGGKLVHIELEQIYITLRATRQRTTQAKAWAVAEQAWLEAEAHMAPGETPLHRKPRHSELAEESPRTHTETVTVSVDEALAAHSRLAVLGDPGSGKTTLLRYLALLYARDLAEGTTLVQNRLGQEEGNGGRLPILLPLRRLGAFLKARRPVDDGTEGHALLLAHLVQMLEGERVTLPGDFFDAYLEQGRAVVLLDGLDEVADPDLRRRVSRLVESFTAAYPGCRYVVSSRIVGYTGPARLGEEYATTTVRDFTLADVERFLCNWHLAVAVGQMGPGTSAAAYAGDQTQQLLAAIEKNERIRDLAINPLMLTVIALVHRDRVKLPDRRAELYDEAVNVLLGKWDEARGVQETSILDDHAFDAGDRRLMLQAVALWMQERQQKEIETGDLRRLLGEMFQSIVGDEREAVHAVDRFLHVIQERTGLLAEHGAGVYRYSHLTFQEYLAALAVAGRDDYVAYTLERVGVPWWREVFLLEAGYLSGRSRERTTRLIRAIADHKEEPEPYHNLVLAAEALRDIGVGRVEGDLLGQIQRRLRADLELDLRKEIERRKPHSGWEATWKRLRGKRVLDEKTIVREIIARRAAVTQALVRSGSGYWTLPYGEPEWIEIPAGEFWMGGEGEYDGKPVHRVFLEQFQISRVPITNAQYRLFVEATDREPPKHWEEKRPPKGKASHPVVHVTWHDAIAYCEWLSGATGKRITLPSEAEWEKAARGNKDQRTYPWGETFDATRCNSSELGLGDTTSVGVFPDGASPYGVLDMAGNVWEWTRSLWGKDYPYDPADGREDLAASDEHSRVLRGGSFAFDLRFGRCAYRYYNPPRFRNRNFGFRLVVVSPLPPDSGDSGL
ncbi:MAG: SUMF1/EgtB/PvdO family nonheme iron enzyme [Chloroflexi bacterium]|nr:SUMF1/EgtB/PvdO family nonheme iron enzyme [Chloroflexota bacterium]